MVDYVEEQQNEIEALESIYPDEFQGSILKIFLIITCHLTFFDILVAISEKEFTIAVYPDEQDEENPRKK